MKNPSENGQKTAYRLADVKQAARGRWPEILQALGIPAALTDTRKHQPCPACGGRDRFRFTNHQEGGGFICNHCTADGGSGFDLLMLVFGYDFKEAVKAVAVAVGLRGGHIAPAVARGAPKAEPKADDAAKAARLLALWAECRPWAESPDVADYLFGRGIPLPESLPVSADIRFHSKMAYWHDGRVLANLPAMVCLYRDVSGKPSGLHITYFQTAYNDLPVKAVLYDPKTRERLPVKKMRSIGAGSLTGAAMRLFTLENGVLGVCEGIETAFAARYVSGVAMWACGSAHGIQSLVLPEGIRELVIIADNDANQTGIRAARALQRRYHTNIGKNRGK
ncbi:MAG: primase-helicase zinc-binding domain-containing protein [Neisseria sp.]|nr:primase-helicase zinc-binding domain-containing protein [Neisseria sp.]